MNEHSSAANEIRDILEGWFGEALENMEDSARVKRFLFDPLCKVATKSQPRVPKVRTSHRRNKEEAARLQAILD
jgi:hypothetical protein